MKILNINFTFNTIGEKLSDELSNLKELQKRGHTVATVTTDRAPYITEQKRLKNELFLNTNENIPIDIFEEIILKGNLYFPFGKKVAPNFDSKSISFFIFLRFKERSPFILTNIFGVVLKAPNRSLLAVPELEKFSSEFFLIANEPSPFPNILYSPGFTLIIFTPSFLQANIVNLTSSDSKTFKILDTPWLIDPIMKLLIDNDLSASTSIVFLKLGILLLSNKLKLLGDIKFKKIDFQNKVLLLLWT